MTECPASPNPVRALVFDSLWDGQQWLTPGVVVLSQDGNIVSVGPETPMNLPQEQVWGYALPGMPNAHSHAFQYAMAGAAEHLPAQAKDDNFWSWRDAMYRLALSVNPDDMQAIAAMLYAEMVAVGYTHVAEFHYLHHNEDGTPYENLAEMGERLVLAAQQAGIRITLVPIYYQQGGFNTPAREDQRRFLSKNREAYFNLFEHTKNMVASYDHASVGVGVHSLRAVPAEDVIATLTTLAPGLPRHIHVAEQTKEVDDCIQEWNARPVEWLLDNTPMDETYHLVHATHTTETELQGVARSRAHIVLCPTTEGNLGDGRFDLVTYRKHRGNWSIGTDSHIGLSPNEELRFLDYTQRLDRQERNVLCQQGGQQSGTLAYNEALTGGKAAVGSRNPLQPGMPCDLVVYDVTSPRLLGVKKEDLLSTIVYACDTRSLLGTIVQGDWVVRHGEHEQYASILGAYVGYKKRTG